jgi:hypothetical protein
LFGQCKKQMHRQLHQQLFSAKSTLSLWTDSGFCLIAQPLKLFNSFHRNHLSLCKRCIVKPLPHLLLYREIHCWCKRYHALQDITLGAFCYRLTSRVVSLRKVHSR